MLRSIQSWLGITESAPAPEQAPLGDLVNALDRLEPSRAQHLARFAYLLGRVALADEHISDEETKAMERLLAEHGGLPSEQATLVVGLAKATHAMFGVTVHFAITQEFTDSASYDERSRWRGVFSRWRRVMRAFPPPKRRKCIASPTSCASSGPT